MEEIDMIKSINEDVILTKGKLTNILNERFDEIDFEDARNDVSPFIKDIESLDLWSSKFFKTITDNIKVL